eukprot:scaffold113829_cov30-Tisochrysis_lutea.AAC.4
MAERGIESVPASLDQSGTPDRQPQSLPPPCTPDLSNPSRAIIWLLFVCDIPPTAPSASFTRTS